MHSENKSAPPPMKIVRGTLIPTNKDNIGDGYTIHQLYMAFTENGLRDVVLFDSVWEDKCITFNSTRIIFDAPHTEENFLNNLNTVMHTDIAQKLELCGEITVIIDTGTIPTVLQIIVANSVVSYRKAVYDWTSPVTLPRKS